MVPFFFKDNERVNFCLEFVCHSEIGDEAVLKTLWDRYEKAVDKVFSNFVSVS